MRSGVNFFSDVGEHFEEQEILLVNGRELGACGDTAWFRYIPDHNL